MKIDTQRVQVKGSGASIGIGQWDGSTNRIEGSGDRDLFITSYGNKNIVR